MGVPLPSWRVDFLGFFSNKKGLCEGFDILHGVNGCKKIRFRAGNKFGGTPQPLTVKKKHMLWVL